MREAGCCDLTMRRVVQEGAKPGALWHIFDPRDADKIRLLLNKVSPPEYFILQFPPLSSPTPLIHIVLVNSYSVFSLLLLACTWSWG